MLRFKFGAWAVVLMLAALSFGACSDEVQVWIKVIITN